MTAGCNDKVFDELIEMRGLRFHFRDWPSTRQNAPNLVLLHGFTGHARSWDTFAEAMTDRYHVLAFDQRGHGETSWAAKDRYSVGDMVGDLECFVSALGLENFALMGLSMGGQVAMTYAGKRPEALLACVIVDMGPELAPSGGARIRASVQATDSFATRSDAFAVARRGNARPPEGLHRALCNAGLMRMGDGRWTYRYDRALRAPQTLRLQTSDDLWRSCADIKAPTQIIRGEFSDILSPEICKKMGAVIPNARLVTVPGAGHGVPFDAPDRFLSAAREFLTG